jgi:hypothetical protein
MAIERNAYPYCRDSGQHAKGEKNGTGSERPSGSLADDPDFTYHQQEQTKRYGY